MTTYRIVRIDSLEHHGIQGMHWGERNGPPYPLTSWQQKLGNAVAKGKRAVGNAVTEYGAKVKAKADAQIAKKKAEKADLDQRKAEAAARKKLTAMGKKHPELLTDAELQKLNNRAQSEQNFTKNYSDKASKGKGVVGQISSSLVKDVAKPAAVALGKAALFSAVGGGDFQKIASVQLGQAFPQNQGNNSSKDKAKNSGKSNNQPKGTFKTK